MCARWKRSILQHSSFENWRRDSQIAHVSLLLSQRRKWCSVTVQSTWNDYSYTSTSRCYVLLYNILLMRRLWFDKVFRYPASALQAAGLFYGARARLIVNYVRGNVNSFRYAYIVQKKTLLQTVLTRLQLTAPSIQDGVLKTRVGGMLCSVTYSNDTSVKLFYVVFLYQIILVVPSSRRSTCMAPCFDLFLPFVFVAGLFLFCLFVLSRECIQYSTVRSSIRHVLKNRGVAGLFLGVRSSIFNVLLPFGESVSHQYHYQYYAINSNTSIIPSVPGPVPASYNRYQHRCHATSTGACHTISTSTSTSAVMPSVPVPA